MDARCGVCSLRFVGWILLVILCRLEEVAAEDATRFQVVENSPTGFILGRIHSNNSSGSNYT